MPTPHTFYNDKIAQHEAHLQQLQRRLSLVAIIRLAVFILLAITAYHALREQTGIWILGAIISLLAFIGMVRFYFNCKDRKLLVEKLLLVNTNEMAVLEDRPNIFPDGQPFLNDSSYLDDLDVFGPRSLFHHLNRTTTSHGTEKLAAVLRQPLSQPAAILRMQGALQAITPQTELRQLMTAKGLLSDEKGGNLHSFADWLHTPSRLYGKTYLLVLRWILVTYNLGALFYYFDTNKTTPLAIGIILGWLFTGSFIRYIQLQHLLIAKKQTILDQYAEILGGFNKIAPDNSALLQEWQEHTTKAHKAIRQLSRLTALFDQRMNILVNFFLNSFFLYDMQCMTSLEKWKEKNKASFPDWVNAVGDIECLNSLASLAFNNPSYSYPTPLAEQTLFITAKQLAHPLIPAKASVANDLSIGKDQKLILVTGSNMSGKTTFLRTIGVNLLLAQSGAPVNAAQFSFTPVSLLTSLRVSDSLQEQTSYFMAELKKLQRIIRFLQTGKPSLVLIDEILRGTNSEDKTYGSEQFIRKLLNFNCLSLFATHDLSLGSLETELPGALTNACFESVIENGELHFNYRLQQGIARNKNASFLMKKMEII